MNTTIELTIALLLTTTVVACDNGASTQRTPEAQATVDGPKDADAGTKGTAKAEPPKPEVVLDEEPRVHLLDNRYRWHLTRDGLVVPFASEGLRKYTQEYRRPWGKLVERQGKTGRTLDRGEAKLRIPWHSGEAATARIWVHGLKADQRVELRINGKRAGARKLDAEWAELIIKIEAGMLRDGENKVLLRVDRKGEAAGDKSYGLFHSMEIVAGDAEKRGELPALTPVTNAGESEVLAGFSKVAMYLEVPPEGWLSLTTEAAEGEATFAANVVTMDGESHKLFETTVAKGSKQPQLVPLKDFADKLVRLELESKGGIWREPFIGIPKAEMRPRPKPFENVILLVVDALRSDRLKLYGESRVDTPRMTAAGKNAVVFLHNQAASPSSPPSHGSIQTGMIPRVHGVVGDSAKLEPGTPMISTQLGKAGVKTAYYGNNPFGMARLEKPGNWTEFHQPNKEGKGIDCVVMMDEMLGFAKKQNAKGKRFFISSLPYEPHTPYRYHEGISEKYHDGSWGPPVGKSVDGYLLGDIVNGKKVLNDAQWSQLKALYDGEVEHWDQCFGQLEDGLAKAGLADTTAIVLTSDHGEGMFEHQKMGHAYGHYAELANVPFIIYAKGFTDDGPRKLETVTSHLDIVPTILDLMGVEPSEKIQGRSVLPVALRQGPWTPRVMSLEYGRSFGLRARRWKLIVEYNGTERLFDLVEDPTEQSDLMGKNDFALRYMREMTGFFLQHRSQWKSVTWGNLGDHGAGFVEHVGG